MHKTCQNKESMPESQPPATYWQRTALKRYRKSGSETLNCCLYTKNNLRNGDTSFSIRITDSNVILYVVSQTEIPRQNHLQEGKSD